MISNSLPLTYKIHIIISNSLPFTCKIHIIISNSLPFTCQIYIIISYSLPFTCKIHIIFSNSIPFTCKIHTIIVPRFPQSAGTLNPIRLSVCLSLHHKNFNLGHNFCTITDRALILGRCVLCDKTFPMVPCRDLDGDLWPTSRSNLLPSGGPQFSEFSCLKFTSLNLK